MSTMQCTFPYPLQSNPLSCFQAGTALMGEFRIDTDTFNDGPPKIVALKKGSWIAVWEGNGGGLISTQSLGQIYDSAGVPVGYEFVLQSNLAALSIGTLNTGGFVAIWTLRGCLKSKGYGKSIGKFFSEGAYRDGIPERLAG